MEILDLYACAAAKMIEEEELLSSARSLALSDANVPQLIRWPKVPLSSPSISEI